VLDLYLAFEAHTEQTIAAGRSVLKTFALLMKVCTLMSILRIPVSTDGITLTL
jgi:hypothetical protein